MQMNSKVKLALWLGFFLRLFNAFLNGFYGSTYGSSDDALGFHLKAVEITSRFRAAHGAPVHLGDPAAIGINNISNPDWGDAVEIRDGEIPVFWACGVTPQLVLQNARPPLCIAHTPGAMLIGDQASDAVSMRWSA
jgi:hypothetical protein